MGDAVMTAADSRARLLQALAVGAAATVAGALVLGGTQGLVGERGLELGYWALALGLLVGAAVGRAGAEARGSAFLAIPVALAGVFLTQLAATAVHLGTVDVGAAYDFWRSGVLGKNDMTFYLVAAAEAFLVSQRVSEVRNSMSQSRHDSP
ncbi:hypothetical protein [Streptomyces sp. WAC 06738]|jgi:hypothetical protein|uniref:hypothetical protein n=1 Tax=Streptomyces sp. WAC 06738 TaxID=2203210 RepID=UPI001F0C4988|nr:hypothetical protein [Streptomyces sp. WAC 06738]